MSDLQFAVIGTGFCGTAWLSKLLTELGYPTTHERTFALNYEPPADGVVGEASLYAVAYPLDGLRVLHLKREPVAFARSARSIYLFADRCPDDDEFHASHAPGAHLQNPLCQFIKTHAPRVGHGRNELERTRIYWQQWNQLCAAKADRTEWVERMWVEPMRAAVVLSWLVGEDIGPDRVAYAMSKLGKVNAKRRRELTLGEARAATGWETPG